MIFQKENDELLSNIAIKNNMDMDKVISAYLICGDDLFMLMHIFEGQDIRIPSKRKLNCYNLHNIKFIEDDERRYADYRKKEILTVKDVDYVVVAPERKVLNHYYLPVIEEDTMENENEYDE